MNTIIAAPSLSTILTPNAVIDGTAVSSLTAANGIIAPTTEGFSTALNAQLLITQPVVTPPTTANIATTTVIASQNSAVETVLTTDNHQVITPDVSESINFVAQQTVSTSEKANNTVALSQNRMPVSASTPEIVMSETDTGILSNVKDVLEFMNTHSLNETLKTPQSVQSLPVSSVIKSKSENVTVATPASEMTPPSQVKTPAIETSTTILAKQATLQTLTAEEQEIPNVATLTVVQNQTGEQLIKSAVKSAQTTEIETPVVQTQTSAVEIKSPTMQEQKKPVDIRTVAQSQTTEIGTPVDIRSVKQSQATEIETPVDIRTVAQSQTTEIETPVDIRTVAQSQATEIETPVDIRTVAQSQTTEIETPVVTLSQTQKTQVESSNNQIHKPVEKTITTPLSQPVLEQETTQTSSENVIETKNLNQSSVKNTLKSDMPQTQESPLSIPTELVANSPVLNTVAEKIEVVEEEITEKSISQDSNSENNQSTTKNENSPVVFAQQSLAQDNFEPLVVAQSSPILVQTENVDIETQNATLSLDEKPTLTPARNLLMDVIANRSNTNSDTSSNNGNNAPSNPALKTEDTPVNLDNKSNAIESKSFASLLTAEKSTIEKTDVFAPRTETPAASSTTDKTIPQNLSAAINKLASEVKMDVPAMTRPLSHPQWNQEMGERIIWMNNQNISSAEIKMNPENLGAITVRIDMKQDQATINFTAQNNDVRVALENSLPKLREMLTSQNLNLADVNVSQQSSSNTNSDSNRQQQTAQMMADMSANTGQNRQNNPEIEFDANGNAVRQINENGEEMAIDEFANGRIIETNGTNGLLSVFA